MEQAFDAFVKAHETGMAIRAGNEAALLFSQFNNRKALGMCDKTAAFAKEHFKTSELPSIYNLAASITQDEKQKAHYLKLADVEKSALLQSLPELPRA